MKPRNILTNLEETLLAMAAIEDLKGGSNTWLRSQHRALDLLGARDGLCHGKDLSDSDDIDDDTRQKVGYTVGEALIECAGRSVKPDDWSEEDWDEMRNSIATIVYGSGGWNRWGVRYNGEVLFSRHHARGGDIELAEFYGFKTW